MLSGIEANTEPHCHSLFSWHRLRKVLRAKDSSRVQRISAIDRNSGRINFDFWSNKIRYIFFFKRSSSYSRKGSLIGEHRGPFRRHILLWRVHAISLPFSLPAALAVLRLASSAICSFGMNLYWASSRGSYPAPARHSAEPGAEAAIRDLPDIEQETVHRPH